MDAVTEIKWILESGLNAFDIQLWLYVRHFATNKSRSNQKLLASRLNTNQSRLRDGAKRLQALGLLEINRTALGGKRGYVLTTFKANPIPGEAEGMVVAPEPDKTTKKPPGRPKKLVADNTKAFGGIREQLKESIKRKGKARTEAIRIAGATVRRKYNAKREALNMKALPGKEQNKYYERVSPFILENDIDVDHFLDFCNEQAQIIGKGLRCATPALMSGPWLQSEYLSRDFKPLYQSSEDVDGSLKKIRRKLVKRGFTRMKKAEDEVIRHISEYANDMIENPSWFPEADPEYKDEINYLVTKRKKKKK